ncbi:MAG TPA: histidinol-phosphatase [Firmicutes bacterium]|nr:histidinol-phosphatase [Bacillota bacterium]
MKIDFHFHILLAKKATFNIVYFNKIIAQANKRGLDAICMTEHFNAVHFEDMYAQLEKTYDYNGHYFDVNGFKVFTGMEVDICEQGHIVIVGHKDNILALRHTLLTKYEQFPTLSQLLDEAEKYPVLKIGAHPYREGRKLIKLRPSLLSRLDAFDLNGKDIHLRKDVERFATYIGLPLVGGSDTHHYTQAGVIVNQFEVECETVDEILQAIKNHQYQIKVNPFIKLKVFRAKWTKKYIKKFKLNHTA